MLMINSETTGEHVVRAACFNYCYEKPRIDEEVEKKEEGMCMGHGQKERERERPTDRTWFIKC